MGEEYFAVLRDGLQRAYAVASEARSQGFDPTEDIEVKIAKDVAARVEGIVGPPGVAEVIRSLERSGMAREDIASELARKIAAGELLKSSKECLIEQAVRTSLGVITEGVLVAPTEGIAKVRIKQNPDGSDYVAVYFASPIRSAGGTAAALSLVFADIARKTCGVGDYRATDSQIMRYLEEVNLYESRVSHLQYMPPEEHIRIITGNCPICIDGEPTEDMEVSAYRGVPGVETDRIRGGVPLVLCEGLAAKAAKVLKYARRTKMGWDWLEKVIKIKKKEDRIEIKPDPGYLDGLVAGRPVFSHPSAKGGFRLRYGRSKTTCLMGKDVHPAIMILLDNFLAYGTHMKIERPGKGCVVSAHDGIEPPVVKLKDGSVRKVRTIEEAYALKVEVEEILFLGDLLCTYGDFLKSNHPLMASGYCEEWWQREVEAKEAQMPGSLDAPSLFAFSRTHNVPLHPRFTFHWHDISMEQLALLAQWLKKGRLEMEGGNIRSLVIPEGSAKRVLEELLVEHHVHDGSVIVSSDDAFALLSSLGALAGDRIDFSGFDAVYGQAGKAPLGLVNELSGIRIRAKAPTYIGARMGRPEKAKERKMDGSPNVLFPTGSFKNRSVMKQYRMLKGREGEKTINLELLRMRCRKCGRLGYGRRCDACGNATVMERICQKCGRSVETEMHCDMKTLPYDRRPVEIVELMDSLRERLGESSYPEDIKGVKGLSNPSRVPERLEKGFLRAKHDVYVFRDGTSRFDATDVPLTHFTPDEVGLTLEKARELGYDKDYLGNRLENGKQTLVLRHQDIILSDNGAEYFMRVTRFIDDMLVNLYRLRPFYEISKKEDLLGHLAVGLSPHTSAGVLCRIIGFTKANVGYGHPYFHTAKRRNCFHGDEKLLVYDGKRFELLAIRDFVERHLKGHTEKDDFGTSYKEISGLKTFSFNKETRRFELADITHVSRHPSPKKLLRLRTKSGRTITVTPDHLFPGKPGQKIKAQDATELPIPWNVENRSISDVEALDLLSMTENQDAMIRTEEDVFDDGQFSLISKDLGMSYKTFTNYTYRKSYPSELVRRFKPAIINNGRYLLGSKRDRVSVRPLVPVDVDLLSILGFYLAEGYMKKNQKDTHQVAITATKPWAKGYLNETIKSVFGIKPSISPNQVVICSGFVHELFRKLGLGGDARAKRVPGFIYSLPEAKRHAFLRGYFSGDGCCSLGSTLEVNVTSVNKWLIDGVSALLLFSGIRHSIREERRFVTSGPVFRFYGRPKECHSYKIRIFGAEAKKFIETIGFLDQKHQHAEILLAKWLKKKGTCRTRFDGDAFTDQVVEKTVVDSSDKYVYNLTVAPHHTLICSGVAACQCDGDEDSIMLLMDALLNFSRKFLSESRGGTMDAPLVLSMEINPKEVDDEAHAIEFVSHYPLEFYEAAERNAMPGDVKIKTVKDVLGTPEQYELPITHPGGTLDVGNIHTAYVTLESIPDKIDIQFSLQERLRPVDRRDAAERLILNHFIPDLYGNLRSFSRQTFRCVNCNTIFRRVPLAGKCSRCGGNLLLTINKGGIEKYLEISRDIVERYDLPFYLKQRLELLEKEIKSVFEDDKIKQTGLSDFL
ncbi:DNA polymerase II large subunit [Candidatus Micrarchaeota archaeon]|nr:DNA polymerase II large subunit [Candidatus Micrarchaeota archaeon]